MTDSNNRGNAKIPRAECLRVREALAARKMNIVLIGMPGSGKTTISDLLGQVLELPVNDCDVAVVNAAGKSIPQIFAEDGEGVFRAYESECLRNLGGQTVTILSTGGGCVTREENYAHLHKNGVVFWLHRDLGKLPTDGRPVSQARGVAAIAREREPLYRAFADCIVDNNGTVEETVAQIFAKIE